MTFATNMAGHRLADLSPDIAQRLGPEEDLVGLARLSTVHHRRKDRPQDGVKAERRGTGSGDVDLREGDRGDAGHRIRSHQIRSDPHISTK